MSQIIDFLISILGYVMRFCYMLTHSYGFSIILFTLLTKFVLFPLNIVTQKNAIRMVQLQPKLDALKIKYIDDKDKYTDEQLALYKEYKYNPFIDTLPLLLQIPIVLGLVGVVYRPLSFVLNIGSETVDRLKLWLTETLGVADSGSIYQLKIIEKLRNGFPAPSDVDGSILGQITSFDMKFCGIDLGMTPSLRGDPVLLLIPALAALSALLLCFAQNKLNVLQLSQGRLNKILTTIFMVLFSLYFAMIVPCGVGLYWIAGNLFAIPLMLLTNLVTKPWKHVDYERLMEMKKQKRLKEEEFRKYHKREKADYKRFFSHKDMQLMFYSENNGFFKYFSGIVDYLCEHSDLTIHYVTSDPNDKIFSDPRKQIEPYYVASDRYLVPLFMKLEADMCVMTMPDLEKYHIKRSRVKKDVEYVFASHAIGSICMYRKGALDWFDTVFSPNTTQSEEIRAYEKLYGTHEKLLVETGYPLIDDLLADYDSKPHPENKVPQIMIAPSWQKDNIIELCGEKILEELKDDGYRIIMRPHPQHVRHEPERFAMLKKKYADCENIEIQTDFSVTNPVMESDILITDWSNISSEFAFVTKRPVLFIDTPMKIMNPDYTKIQEAPVNKTMRTLIGEVISPDEVSDIGAVIKRMLADREGYREKIEKAFGEYVFNIGKSSELCGKYIIKTLKRKRRSADASADR